MFMIWFADLDQADTDPYPSRQQPQIAITAGLLRRQGVVKRTHLVPKLIEQRPISSDGERLYNARNRRVIRRCAVFADASVRGWSAISCCHDRSSDVGRSGGR